MPSIFKALASITAWILFIWGVITILSTTVAYYTVIGINNALDLSIQIGWGLGTVELVLSVCVMRLRQKME